MIYSDSSNPQPDIRHRVTDTFSYRAVVTLPGPGVWSAKFFFLPSNASPTQEYVADLTLIGPNAGDVTKKDYALHILVSSQLTSTWPVSVSSAFSKGIVRFFDDSVPKVEFTSLAFTIGVDPQLVPATWE